MMVLSSRSGSIDSVSDDVQRTGQIQTTDLGPDARTAQLKLGAVLQSEEGVLRVFPAGGEFRRGEPLRLHVLHPYEADADQVVTMAPDALGWHAELALDASHRSEEHTSELQSLMRISYAVFCLKKKTTHR